MYGMSHRICSYKNIFSQLPANDSLFLMRCLKYACFGYDNKYPFIQYLQFKMVRRNTWDNYLTSAEGSLRRVQFREARHSGKSVGQSDQVALRVNYNTFCELFITDNNICSIIVLHHACHFVSNLGYNLIYFPQIYALYCPILEQCKVPPSSSKKTNLIIS